MVKPFQILDLLLRLKRVLCKRKGKAKGLLIISAGGLGDTVLFSLFASRFASLALEDELVTILLRNDSAKMSFVLPKLFRMEIVNFKDFRKSLSYRHKIANRLFNLHYRLIITTDQLRHPDLDEAMIEMAAPEQALAMEPRSWPKYDAQLQLNRRLYKRLFDSGPNKLDKVVRWNNFANWLLGTKMLPPKVHIDFDTLADKPKLETPDVLIQPFSAVAFKQSPVDIYRKIIESFSEGTSVAIVGTPSDLDANPQYKELLDLPGVSFNSALFKELVPDIRAAKLVISVDTATMHLSAAIGTSTLCLASAAYVGEIVPYAPEVTPDNVHVIYKTMDCEGCLGECHLAPINDMYPCVAGLDNNLVISKALELLQI
jgi:ADP-heptose:LPS heptosyltransferase